ncbi:energy transducer TonB [Psychrobium sp. nBUS_13]|uniref:energy transducer TonB n=1 Tax=Psychrobium sp. nBUS_13 TaxID=3395319 RepID=UPI003EC0C785
MKIKRHHFYTLLLTSGFMLLAIALLFVNQWFAKQVEPQVLVREVHVAALPPPPPPPPPQQSVQVEQSLNLSLEGDGAAMDVALVEVEKPQLQLTPPPVTMQMDVDFSNSLSVDWQAFGLNELDSLPSLLTRTKTNYPRTLMSQGINKVTVKLDVFIDESGRPKLLSVESPHQKALTKAITTLIKRSRFTPPTKDGQTVAARFIWPVEFKKS